MTKPRNLRSPWHSRQRQHWATFGREPHSAWSLTPVRNSKYRRGPLTKLFSILCLFYSTGLILIPIPLRVCASSLKFPPSPLSLQYQSAKTRVLRVWSWDSSISTRETGNVNSVAPRQTSLLDLVNASVISQPKPLFFQDAFPDLLAQWNLSSGRRSPPCTTYFVVILHASLWLFH